MSRSDLCPRPYWLRAFLSPVMRLSNDVRRAVVFIGTGASDEFRSCGTAFFLSYKGIKYLVTAAHVVHELGDDPYAIRLNKDGGSSALVNIDPLQDPRPRWHILDADPGVDIAITTYGGDLRRGGFNHILLAEDMLLSNENVLNYNIGPGDSCYTVGLFSRVAGKDQNLPIVHTGNIALSPGEERVTVRDWRNSSGNVDADVYLVESVNLRGLSGAPVFVRPTINLDIGPTPPRFVPSTAVSVSRQPMLLGVWQGSWEATADDLRSNCRVPIGMGIVAPSNKIAMLLEQEEVVNERKYCLDKVAAGELPNAD